MKFDPSILLPADVLVYRPQKLSSGFWGWLFGHIIALKTWTRASHCEIYIGNNLSLASRDSLGVNKYALRENDVGFVLRPLHKIEMDEGLKWFYNKAVGQRYDWAGLLVFCCVACRGNNRKMFCSEFVCRLFRDGFKLPLFAHGWDCDRTPPSMLLSSLNLETVWTDGNDL